MTPKEDLLCHAAQTVTKKQKARRSALLRMLHKTISNKSLISQAEYYLRLGSIPQSLWSNG